MRAHGEQVVFVKRVNERREHVLIKAFLWALYLPHYPALLVEVSIADRYKPDLVSPGAQGETAFWGEAGRVTPAKIRSLVRRYRDTHFALAKWDTDLDPFIAIVRAAVEDLERSAPFDLLVFPPDGGQRFVDERGEIEVSHDDLDWIRLK